MDGAQLMTPLASALSPRPPRPSQQRAEELPALALQDGQKRRQNRSEKSKEDQGRISRTGTFRRHMQPSPLLREGSSPEKGLKLQALSSRDGRLHRTPSGPKRTGERGVGGESGKGSDTRAVNSQKPLATIFVPITGRKAAERGATGHGLNKASREDFRWDNAPDVGSGGREGRQFTVANVGHSGRIYLRPSVRPGHQRFPQPPFIFPMTPPSTAGLDTFTSNFAALDDDIALLRDSLLTPPAEAVLSSALLRCKGEAEQRNRRRAMSDSTITDINVTREAESGGFKVVVTRLGKGKRPGTAQDAGESADALMLDVPLPGWKLGTPRFSTHGTPFIRGSSYAPTEASSSNRTSVEDHTPRETYSAAPQKPASITSSRLELGSSSPQPVESRRTPAPLRASLISTMMVVRPSMFDALTFKPDCDDRAIVRYSPSSGAVTAGTPPRLVAEITSPSLVDYELLSDFFLTFRAFLEPSDLLRMLIARLRWALARSDEMGMVVRVRTFVALRHWILNYFMDDFVVDYNLRVTFCSLLNNFVDEQAEDAPGCKVQIKILTELKKCWRRVCAQYWDGPEFDMSLGPGTPISPGGIAGHRSPNLDPTFWEELPPRLDGLLPPHLVREHSNWLADVSRAGHVDTVVAGVWPITPPLMTTVLEGRGISADVKGSRTSINSDEVVSCSFPTKSAKFGQLGTNHARGPQPVDPSNVSATHSDPIAATPQRSTEKRSRTHTGHRHKASVKDATRRANEGVLYNNAKFVLTLPYAGSLVRGNLLPPTQAYVEAISPGRQTTIFQPHVRAGEHRGHKSGAASAMSGQGMRKLLGSVRRALGNYKLLATSAGDGQAIDMSPLGPKGATTNRLPGTAIVPHARPRQENGAQPLSRIDILGAEVIEDFKKAVREDAAVVAERQQQAQHSRPSTTTGTMKSDNGDTAKTEDIRSIANGDAISLLNGMPAATMSGALPVTTNASVVAFADSLLAQTVDPTPPNTPPSRLIGTPRKSSYILSHHVLRSPHPAHHSLCRRSDVESGVSPFLCGIGNRFGSRHRPPLRNDCSQAKYGSNMTKKSVASSLGVRRQASFTSAITAQPTARSFDANTSSGASVENHDLSMESPAVEPLRILRRRPGGNLRGATNVGQLDDTGLHRCCSTGSLTTFSESVHTCSLLRSSERDTLGASSGFVDILDAADNEYSLGPGGAVLSLGALTQQQPRRAKQQMSLFSTHSSKPIMRASFEAEAQKLAQIPDDASDDGGVESALLKLEGKFEKRPARPSMQDFGPPVPKTVAKAADEDTENEIRRERRHVHVGEEPSIGTRSPVSFTQGAFTPARDLETHQSFGSEESDFSYSSIPLLERGVTDDDDYHYHHHKRPLRPVSQTWLNRSVLEDSAHLSYVLPWPEGERVVVEPVPEEAAPLGSAVENRRTSTNHSMSFLDTDSEDEDGNGNSEISSDMSGDAFDSKMIGGVLGTSTPRPDDDGAYGLRQATGLHQTTGSSAKPTLPATYSGRLRGLHDEHALGKKPLQATTDTSPMAKKGAIEARQHHNRGANRPAAGASKPVNGAVRSRLSAHLPFILAFESQVLAEQFTLIEKDALSDIDWKDLIEMSWKDAQDMHINARSWVSFLRNTDARGVEVVIARFNLVVKWAASEIVLTQNIEERARCIIKFIHIAAHCRRYRNFATMSQLAIALTTTEVSRLRKTWAMVPPSDVQTLQAMEALISPTRNFYSLRAEMEGGALTGVGVSAQAGCIPFVGIYTHDLLFNAQRPSEIASSPASPPLINFERSRTSASVVKTLLRLLEASTHYNFQPVEDVTERCLWMGALSDDEIRTHSEALE